MLEIKRADEEPVKSFQHFSSLLPKVDKLQLVKELKREKTYPNGIEVRSLIPWLARMKIL